MTREESNELIDMLTIIKGQAIKSNNDTAIINIKIDSFNFVVDKAIKALEQEPVLDKIRTEICKSKTKHEMQIAERDIKAKLLISDIYCDIVNILDKYKAEIK